MELGLLATTGTTLPEVLKKPAKDIVNKLLIAGEDIELRFRRWVINGKKLPPEELDIYENSDYNLKKALIKGVVQLSQKQPVLLVIDTYERVDNKDVDEWLRGEFLKDLYLEGNKVMVIISGRNNHFKQYRTDLFEENVEHLCFDDILFTTNDIKEFASEYQLKLSAEELETIEKYTQGVPIVVKETLLLLKSGENVEIVLEDLTYKTGQIRDIVRGVVERFLRYCHGTDTEMKVFQLTMLRHFDSDVLKEIWNMSGMDISKLLNDLSGQHSFIIRNRIHDLVKEILREHLINELGDENDSGVKGIIQDFGDKSSKFYHERLLELESKNPKLEDRYTDENYLGAIQDYFNCLMWYDQYEVFKELPGYFLEWLEYNPDFALQVLQIIAEFISVLISQYRSELDIYAKGLMKYDFRGFWNEHKPEKEEIELLKNLNKYQEELSRDQEVLLYCRWGEMYLRSGKYDLAKQEFDKCNKLVINSAKFGKTIADNYFAIGYAYNNLGHHEEALKSYEKAVGINREYHEAWNNMGIAYDELGQYEETIRCYEQALEIKDDFYDAHGSLGWIYYKTGQYEKSIEASLKGLSINPDAIWIRSNLALAILHTGNTEEANIEYDKVISLAKQVSDLEEDAIDDLQEAIKNKPNLVGAKEILQKLQIAKEKLH